MCQFKLYWHKLLFTFTQIHILNLHAFIQDDQKFPLHFCKNSAALCWTWWNPIHVAYMTHVVWTQSPPTPPSLQSTVYSFTVTFIPLYAIIQTGSSGLSTYICYLALFQKQFVLLPQKQLVCYYFMICSLLVFWFKVSLLQCECRPVYLQKTHTLKPYFFLK